MDRADLAARSRMVGRLAELHKKNEALRADLEAVAVGAQEVDGLLPADFSYPAARSRMHLALARPGVQTVLKDYSSRSRKAPAKAT